MKAKQGFTLIELLVVVSIIALLVSILMPALGKARDQAKLVSDAANCRQIAMLMGLHQADHEGAVPVLYNRYLSNMLPAKNCYLSLALQDYTEVNLGADLDPDEAWHHQQDKYQKYCETALPEYFTCPFARGREYGTMSPKSEMIKMGDDWVEVYKNEGANTHYGAWNLAFGRGENCWILNRKNQGYAGLMNRGNIHPLGLPHGTPKYGAQVWFSHYKKGSAKYPWERQPSELVEDPPIAWDSRDARAVGSSSLSEVVVLMCIKGEFTTNSNITRFSIYNHGSHRRGNTGGTNAIFADCHVEWVEGSRIGWQ